MSDLRFYFDVVCPYAYLASTQIERLAERTGANLLWRPMLLGGVFRAIGRPDPVTLAPARVRWNALDLDRWARRWDVPLRWPDAHPRRTVDAMRLVTAALPLGRAPDIAHALFRAYWVEGRDVADRAVLAAIAKEHGIDPAAIDRDDVKQALRDTTDEAVREGVFGAPSFVVDAIVDGAPHHRLYWGQDRLHLVERALRGGPLRREPEPREPARAASPDREVIFYYDFSSPFTYLASTQIERVAAERGARVTWRPILLGGLFKALGQATAPIQDMLPPKRRYQGLDLDDWARFWGVPFRWPSRFPMRTLAPLRMCLALEAASDEPGKVRLGHALFRAYWAEDRDISDEPTLAAIADGCGLDGAALLARTADPAIKERLGANTDEALRRGVFGLPSYFVGDELHFGQDRLDFVSEALAR